MISYRNGTKSLLCAGLLTLTSLNVGLAQADSLDTIILHHDIYEPLNEFGNSFNDPNIYFQLAGQSAYMQQRLSSGTSGGQLDGATGLGDIQFFEVFPPADINEYQTYSYIGVVETYGYDGDSNPGFVTDRSIVIGFLDTTNVLGQTINTLFPSANGGQGYDEATLVTRFTTVFDSDEFFDMAFGQVSGQTNTSADMRVAELDCQFTNTCFETSLVRSGQQLQLVAFVGGTSGDEGVLIGTIDTSLYRYNNLAPVPEPETWAMLLAGLGLVGFAARRRAMYS